MITEYQVYQDQVLFGFYSKKNILEDYCKEYCHLYNQSIVCSALCSNFTSYKIVQKAPNASSLQTICFKTVSSQNYIHRFHGDTLNEAFVDLSSAKREHMHYVSLSRLRSISGTRTFCRKTLCRKTFCRRTLCQTDSMTNGLFAEKTFCRNDY